MSKHPLEPAAPHFPSLGLDVSQRRIGFALSFDGKLVFPRGFLERESLAEDVKNIRIKMQDTKAVQLVLGLPLRTDGKPSPQAQRVRALGHALRENGMELFYQDERFTTQSARADLDKGATLGEIDAQSAVHILELFLGRWENLNPLETLETFET